MYHNFNTYLIIKKLKIWNNIKFRVPNLKTIQKAIDISSKWDPSKFIKASKIETLKVMNKVIN